jgi:hypothetical protein
MNSGRQFFFLNLFVAGCGCCFVSWRSCLRKESLTTAL